VPEDLVDADYFVAAFLTARQIAAEYGVKWLTSGSRPWETHGPYCNVFRDVLQLVPGGSAVHCFKVTETSNEVAQTSIGQPQKSHFVIDQQQTQRLRRQLSRDWPTCHSCFNRFHCARGCPDLCLLDEQQSGTSLRCDLLKGLATAHIQSVAQDMRSQLQGGTHAIGTEIARP
jgi:radical SAM protein with 4Fe4S-binding SPASM domain